MFFSLNYNFNKLIIFSIMIIIVNFIFNLSYVYAGLEVTSNDPNYGVGTSNTEFSKTWLCKNIGTTNLNVTLTSGKSERSPGAWGLNNLSENFNLEAGGTQNCGIKLTTNGEKGLGDVLAQIKTDDGFERNVSMTFFTDVYSSIFVNGSEGQNLKNGELYKYIYSKQAKIIEFDKNDFNNLSPLILETNNYFYVGGSNGEIDSVTAERISEAFLNGKNVFICGAESFYKLFKTHPNHRVWSALRFDLSEEIVFDLFQSPYNVTIKNLIDETTLTTNNFFQNPFNISEKPIRKVIPRITSAMQNTKLFYLNNDENKIIGFAGTLGNAQLTFLNIDLEGLFFIVNEPDRIEKFYNNIFDNLNTSIISTNEILSYKVITYPNPTEEYVTFNLENINITNTYNDQNNYLSKNQIDNEFTVRLYDINSNIIENINYHFENNSIKLKTNNLSNSKYFVEINILNQKYVANFNKIK